MKKLILQGTEAEQALDRGVEKVYEAVSSTLGPKASNVAIAKAYENPTITHDGVTVSKSIILEDPFEDVGAQLIREAAAKTNDEAGDGTTTATVLAHAIIKEGRKEILAGQNRQVLKDELVKSQEKVLKELDKLVTPIQTRAEKEQIAIISSANRELGLLIVDAVEKAGKDGTVSINEMPIDDVMIEHTVGMEFERGYISPYFITDDKNRCGINDPYILVTDYKLSSIPDIVEFMDVVTKVSKNIVIIADDVEGEALAALVVNRQKGYINPLAVKAPALGLRRKQLLEDIAVLTGATVISEDTGRALSSITVEDLGRAERVLSDKESTLIVNGKGLPTDIERRISNIKAELAEAVDEYDKEQLRKRIAKLSSGVVVINVGGKTEMEMKERKFRIEDALNATQAAIEEGIVPGGETALLKASRVLGDSLGDRVLRKALEKPFLKLLSNAGIEDGELIAKAKKAWKNLGVDVMQGEIVDLVKEGVIDPVKVTKSALKNAVAVGSYILTTQTLIVDKEEVHEGKNSYRNTFQ